MRCFCGAQRLVFFPVTCNFCVHVVPTLGMRDLKYAEAEQRGQGPSARRRRGRPPPAPARIPAT